MYTLRSILFVLVCSLGFVAVPALAQSGDESGSEGVSMMGAGSGGMMSSGSGTMVGSGAGTMMGSGTGAATGGGPTAGSQQAGAKYLDAIGERITQRFQLMQRIAEAKDKSAKRQLVQQYLQTAHQTVHRYGRYPGARGSFGRHWRGWGPGMMGYGSMGYGATGPGMMGYGPMGYGAMGPGMMGYGARGYGAMGPGMMGYGPMGYGAMGPGMMGYGPMGYGAMGPGMMGYGPMGSGVMGYGARAMMSPGGLSDEQLDRMAEHMAEMYKDMQHIAQTTDKAERRKLLREHFKDMRDFWQDQDDEDEDQ